jgi:hypothetical protein
MSVAGKWQVTMPTPIGTMNFRWEISEGNGAWSGQMTGDPPIGDSELTDIQASGDAIAFGTVVQSPMGALPLTFEGAASSDTMTGTCKTRFGNNPFTAVRL